VKSLFDIGLNIVRTRSQMASRVGSIEERVDMGFHLVSENVVLFVPYCYLPVGESLLLVVGSTRGWFRSPHPVNILEIADRVGRNSEVDSPCKERNLVRGHRSRKNCDRKKESRKKSNRLEVHDDSGFGLLKSEGG